MKVGKIDVSPFHLLAFYRGRIEMMTAEIRKMSISERLRTMEAIWDSLLYDDAEMPSPAWHGNVLAGRKKTIDEREARFLSIEEVKEGITLRRKFGTTKKKSC